MVVLLGLTAFAVDAGRLVSAKAQLQNGADAGALAAAKYCSLASASDCTSNASGVAAPYGPANSQGNVLAGTGLVPTGGVTFPTSNEVKVTTTTPTSGLSMIFAGVIGIPTAQVSASATAQWGGAPRVGPAVLPIAVAPCQITPDTGITQYFYLKSDTNSDALNTSCPPDSTAHGPITGGFQWLLSGTQCITTPLSDSGGVYFLSDPGVNLTNPCKIAFQNLLNTIVLLPVFSGTAGNGAGGKYYVTQWAAVKLVGYRINPISGGVSIPGGNNTRGIAIQFVTYVADPSVYSSGGGTDHGVTLPPKLIIP
jgi:hypothetical protein